jgi:hypothetical protein
VVFVWVEVWRVTEHRDVCVCVCVCVCKGSNTAHLNFALERKRLHLAHRYNKDA